jgi:hypothetical protein
MIWFRTYLEKLIQIPYPPSSLSPAEIERYINLLACQKHLTGDSCNIVIENWSTKRSENLYGAYRQAAIRQVLSADAITEEFGAPTFLEQFSRVSDY